MNPISTIRNQTVMQNMVREYREKTSRDDGYYWVHTFDTISKQERWEPGSWDNTRKAWALLGTQDLWYEFQLIEVGQKINVDKLQP